jgi:outer membrane protein OmpA-like peptidoglycan-associated protein
MFVLFIYSCKNASYYTKKGNLKFASGEYDFAIQHYHQALSKGGNKELLNYKIGEAYRLSNRLYLSAPYYAKALELNPKLDTAIFFYALSLKYQGNYEQALNKMEEYNQKGRTYEFRNRAVAEIAALKKWQDIYKKISGFKIKNAGFLNTTGSDFGLVELENKNLVFSSSRNQSKIYRATGQGFLDLFMYKFDGFDSTSGQAIPFPKPIYDEDTHEACATFSPNGNVMVFAKSNDGSKKGRKETDLFISIFKGGRWTNPQLLKINTKDAWTSTPMFSHDGKTLYFASNRKGGYGGIDLYKATVVNDTDFVDVTNLGPKINTNGNEMFPYLAKNGRFYFASDGHPGLGGLDLFYAQRDSATGALEIENLGQPINSKYDDFAIYFTSDSTGFFSSNREGGKGDDDIYEFKYKPIYILELNLDVEFVRSDSNTLIDNLHLVIKNNDKMIIDTILPHGKITLKLEQNLDYQIFAERKGFFAINEVYTTRNIKPIKLKEGLNKMFLYQRYTLNPIILNKEIVLENIYYDYNKTEIRPDAAIELDKVVKLMKDNPKIKIELGSHTDSRGDHNFNMKLSQGRADAAVQYIISKGIDPKRIVAKGYGETMPIVVDEKTEEDYQKNRRTEFKVIEIED